jgi:hypothetical protein
MNMPFSTKTLFIPLLAAAVLLTAARSLDAQTVVIAGWETTGLSSYGPSPWAPTTLAANISVVGLTRGAGVGVSGTAAGSTWGGSAWQGQTDLESATAVEAFVTFSFTPAAGFKASLTSVGPYNLRRPSTGPQKSQWQYRVGDGEFVNLGDELSLTSTASGGNNFTGIDLSVIEDLQDIPPGVTVEFRIVNFGASGTGPWYLNNRSTAGEDLVFNGVIEAENPDAPLIEISATGLPVMRTPIDSPSAPRSFDVSGVNLAGDLLVTAPSGFEVSQTAGGESGYAPTQTLALASLPATVYVRLLGSEAGSFAGNVSVSSDGATTQNVSVSGVVLAAAPLTADAAYQQNFLGYSADAPELPLGWSVAGSNTTFPASAAEAVWGFGTGAGLRGAASVFGYQHTGTTGAVQQTLTLRNDTGAVLDTVYVRYTGRVARVDQGRSPSYVVTVNGVPQPELGYSTFAGEDEIITAEITGLAIPAGTAFQITWTSDGSDAGSPGSGGRRQIGVGAVTVSTSAIVSEPNIAVAGTLTPFTASVDSPSASQSFTVAGSGLANGISITAPAGFQLSLDDESFRSSVTLFPAVDSLPPTTVYVRLAASATPGVFSGLISSSSTGAVTRDVAVTGTVGEPSGDYDAWAGGFGLDPNVTTGPNAGAPTADPDGDGFTNEQEFAFGTNPTVGNAALLQATTDGNGNLVFTYIERDAGVTYAIETRANLSTGSWQAAGLTPTVSSDQSGVESGYTRKQFIVADPEGNAFYRVRASIQ